MALNIVIGWSMLNSRDMDFKKDFINTVLSIDELDTDRRHIKFLMTMDGINRTVNRGGADILIIHETINTVNIGTGTIQSYLSKAPDMRIILIVPDDRRSSGKLKGLFEAGFYDCLYESELDAAHIEDLIYDPRGEAEAYDYYGLADYDSPLDRKGERTRRPESADEEAYEGEDSSDEQADADSEPEVYESSFFDEVIVDGPKKKKAPAADSSKKRRPVPGEDIPAGEPKKRGGKSASGNKQGQTPASDEKPSRSERSRKTGAGQGADAGKEASAGQKKKNRKEETDARRTGRAERAAESPSAGRETEGRTSSRRKEKNPDMAPSRARNGEEAYKPQGMAESAMFSGALNSADLPEWDADLREEREREERIQKQKDLENALLRETKKLEEGGYFDELTDDKAPFPDKDEDEEELSPSEISRLGTNDPLDRKGLTEEEQEIAAFDEEAASAREDGQSRSYDDPGYPADGAIEENAKDGGRDYALGGYDDAPDPGLYETAASGEASSEYSGTSPAGETSYDPQGEAVQGEPVQGAAVQGSPAGKSKKKKKKGAPAGNEGNMNPSPAAGAGKKQKSAPGSSGHGAEDRQTERTAAGEALSVPLTVPEEAGNSPFFSMSDSEIASYLSEKQHEVEQPKLIEVPEEPFANISEQVLMHYIKEETTALANFERGITSEEDFKREVSLYIAKNFDLTPEARLIVYNSFYSFMFEYDEIEGLIDDESVSDVKTYDQDNIRIKRNGEREQAMVKFRSFDHYTAFLSHLARRNHRSITGGNAQVKFMDTKSSDVAKLRVNISTEFINSSGSPFMHIRKTPKKKYTTEELIEKGMFSPRTAAFLINCAQNDSGMVFTGKGSAGKTTLMNWLVDYIPRNKSGLCIQESDELYSETHPDILFQNIEKDEAQVQDGENAQTKDYDLKTLAQNGLLIDIDYFIIGEIKDAEAKYFLNAAYTGNRCWASVHSPSSQDALPRIADLAKYDTDYSKDELLKMLVSLHTIIFLRDFRVAEISQIVKWDEDKNCLVYRRIPIL